MAELTLTDCSSMAKVLVHAHPSGGLAERLAVPFGQSRRDGDGTLILRVRPAQWLLLADSAAAPELVERWEAAAIETAEFVSVIDVTSGRTVLRLTGDASPALLAKICAVELGADDGSALRSSVARVNAEIVRDDVGGRRSYLLACERSYGRFLTEVINDARVEFV